VVFDGGAGGTVDFQAVGRVGTPQVSPVRFTENYLWTEKALLVRFWKKSQ
jgi:hypothetical protein